MVLYTYLVRTPDGLPLAASVDENDGVNLQEQKRQLKVIAARISASSEPLASIESGQYSIHYLLADGVVYMAISEQHYPRKLAFSYLEELSKEFSKSYGATVHRPGLRSFAYAEFDNFMQRTKRLYQDARASQNIDKLNSELQDVTKVMTKNIEDLLYRGDSLDKMQDLSSNLRSESKKYRKAARRVNFEAMLKQYAPAAGFGLIVLFFIWWRFL